VDERAAFREVDDSITALLVHLVRSLAALFSAFLVAHFVAEVADVPSDALVARGGLFAVLATVSIFFAEAVPIRKAVQVQRATIAAREEMLRREAARHQFAADLQDALEMADSEADGLEVVARAFEQVAGRPTELLLADSSRAHLRRAVVHAPDGVVPGCQVDTPWACPAVRRGQTLAFASTNALAACPHLRDRPTMTGDSSATCIPVTVLGTPTGVIHVLAREDQPVEQETVATLEALARQAGARIGVLRAIASTELQASTDPLTGLVNRRRLESEIRRLRETLSDYALILADLDEFKRLNDTYGHETGDRALRLFARVLERVTRDNDVACRYGGEEFVVVLPDARLQDAVAVVERARLELISLLANGDVPPFTASFGIAHSGYASQFDEVMRLADEALFAAKQAGRNRHVVAEPPAPVAAG